MKGKITLSFAKLLIRLRAGEVNRGEFRGCRDMLEKFIADGVLDFRVVGRQQQKVYCSDLDNLHRYLHHKFEIPSLDQYIIFLESEEAERSDAVKASSDSKRKKSRVFQGFFINSLESITAELDGDKFVIKPARGAYTFITAYDKFLIPEDVTVVVVENYENFREIDRQRYLFKEVKPLFVWRYQNTNTVVEWLLLNGSPYLHFGDFDLKGIHIYLSEFKSKLPEGRSKFLIPDGIEDLLVSNGARFLYDDQQSILISVLGYKAEEPLQELIELIRRHKKGLSQEILIT